MPDLDARGEAGILRVFVRLVANDDDAFGAFRFDLARDLRNAEPALDRLPARHRHRVVVEDLIGDVHARGGSIR